MFENEIIYPDPQIGRKRLKDITAKRIVIKQDLKKYHSEYRDINICLSGDFIIQDRYGEILSKNEIKQIIELGVLAGT